MIDELTFRFSGRYGNNIVQLINSLHVHLHRNNSFLVIPNSRKNHIIPKIIDKHNIYNQILHDNTDLIFLNNASVPQYHQRYLNNIYYWNTKSIILDVPYITFEERLDQLDILVHEILELTDIPSISKDDLLIHIRSTDIFKSNPHASYAQPPISFYRKVIEDFGFKHIYILSDDNNNFTIQNLKSIYGSIITIIQERNIKAAFNILRNATHVCTSTSSFCTMATILKPISELKNIYTYEYLCYKPGVWHYATLFDHILKRPTYNFHIYRIDNYPFMIKKNNEFISNWNFTNQTKEIMKNHNISNISKLLDHEYR